MDRLRGELTDARFQLRHLKREHDRHLMVAGSIGLLAAVGAGLTVYSRMSARVRGLLAAHTQQQRRLRLDLETAHTYGTQRFATSMLSTVDNLERAAAGSQDQGVQMTLKGLLQTLEENHVYRIDVKAGDMFDPERHDAVAVVENKEKTANTVADVMQSGYLLHDRVIRPARVSVVQD